MGRHLQVVSPVDFHAADHLEPLEARLCLSVNFSPPVLTPLGAATLLASGDFNGDSTPDLVVRGASTSTNAANAVRVHAGLGDGRFAPVGTSVWSGPDVSSIVVADFNEDDKLDLAFTNDQFAGTITFSFGRGDGTFGGISPTTVIPQALVGANPKGAVVGDFNGDDNLDLLVANGSPWAPPGTLQPVTHGPGLLLGNGNGTFQSVKKLFNGGESHTHVAAGDIDNDGDLDAVLSGPDVLSASPIPQSTRYTLLNDSHGGFAVTRAVLFTYHVRAVHLADLNGDGRDDLVALQELPANTSLAGTTNLHTFLSGNSTGANAGSVAPAKVARPAGLSAADFDRDGRIDVAVAGVGPASATNAAIGVVSVLRGNGDGTLAPPKQFRTHAAPLAQLTGDFNGDGRTDIVTGSASGASALLGTSPASPFTDDASRKTIAEVIGLID